MKITLGSKTLLEKLQFLGAIIGSKAGLPILDSFHFVVSNNLMTITSSDLESTITTTMAVDSDVECDVCIQAKMLIEILKSFPDTPLVFIVNDNNTVEIKSASGDYSIAYDDGAQFPKPFEMKGAKEATISAKVLANAIAKTMFAVGTDDLRPVMTGILFQLSPSGSNFVATDAHKLVKYSRTDVVAEDHFEFVVSKKPLSVLKTILGGSSEDVSVEFNDTNAVFQFESYVLSCRLIDAKYPNYQAVIPTENPNVLTLHRGQFLNAVKCVSIFANRLTHQVKLTIIGNDLKVSAADPDYSNSAEERMTSSYEGDDMTIGFNSRFLIEMLSSLSSDNVTLEMSLPNRAGILRPVEGTVEGEAILMLVMPVLVN